MVFCIRSTDYGGWIGPWGLWGDEAAVASIGWAINENGSTGSVATLLQGGADFEFPDIEFGMPGTGADLEGGVTLVYRNRNLTAPKAFSLSDHVGWKCVCE